MKKSTLAIAAILIAGSACLALALGAAPHASAAKKRTAHVRIVKLGDRIRSQRDRIRMGLHDRTLTAVQARADRAVLASVVGRMAEERKANGARKVMAKDRYDAYNSTLDANSANISEEKRDFYYYGPYEDVGPDYDYYYDAYPPAAAALPAPRGQARPWIFELRERMADQRDQIDKGVIENTLSQEQATAGRDVLASVDRQMKADRAAAHSVAMTAQQFNAYNTALDANSLLLREQRHPYYYYGPGDEANATWD